MNAKNRQSKEQGNRPAGAVPLHLCPPLHRGPGRPGAQALRLRALLSIKAGKNAAHPERVRGEKWPHGPEKSTLILRSRRRGEKEKHPKAGSLWVFGAARGT